MRTTRALSITIAAVALLLVGLSSPAGAQDEDYPPTTPTSEVLGETLTPPTPDAAPEPEVISSGVTPASAGGSGGLPVTGGDVLGLAVAGLIAIGVGTVLVRRRPTDS